MMDYRESVTIRITNLLAQVQARLGDPVTAKEDAPFGELLDSMAMVEFIALLADEYGVSPTAIENCVGHQFTTVAALASALIDGGLVRANGRDTGVSLQRRADMEPQSRPQDRASAAREKTLIARKPSQSNVMWLAGTTYRLPELIEPADRINHRLGRPAGWLQRHAGIMERRIWGDEDPLAAAASAGQECLQQSQLSLDDVAALLVTSEAPPLLAGLASAVHHRMDLPSRAIALEIGGACTGYLSAAWLAQSLVHSVGTVIVIAVEAATHYLRVEPGDAGEAAALFGDGVAASVFAPNRTGPAALRVNEVILGGCGAHGGVLRIERPSTGDIRIRMKRIELAGRAIEAMSQGAVELARRHGFALNEASGVVAHGGNGRMPALLARQLGISPEQVWSEASRTGNLGSASIPVGWASRTPRPQGPVIWTAAGAGLTWGAALVLPAA
jgi:3-oxoacyl-[acyl-carrier-protein] synthase-3